MPPSAEKQKGGQRLLPSLFFKEERMADISPSQFEGEMAAPQHRRKMESLNSSPVSAALSRIADVAIEDGKSPS
jgi:hypothetical protein